MKSAPFSTTWTIGSVFSVPRVWREGVVVVVLWQECAHARAYLCRCYRAAPESVAARRETGVGLQDRCATAAQAAAAADAGWIGMATKRSLMAISADTPPAAPAYICILVSGSIIFCGTLHTSPDAAPHVIHSCGRVRTRV